MPHCPSLSDRGVITMTDPLATVHPGDLIRADDYNQLIAQVNDLTTRVERLEAGGTGGATGQPGAPVIDTINPASPRIGDTVVITGHAFDYSVGAARVTMDGLFVTLLAGSSDTTLIFQVPQLASIPDGGRPVQIVVSNLRLSTTQSLIVLPELPLLQGNVSIQFQDTQPSRITADQPCTFHFQLVSDANLPVTLTLTPTVSVPAWQAGLQVLDDAGSVLPTAQVTVGALMTRDFFIRVAQITAAAQTFTLTVVGQGQGIVTSSGAQAFTVGQVGAQDPDIRLTIEGVVVTAGGSPLSGTTVTLTKGERAELDLLAKFRQTGQFTWSTSFDPAASASSWQPDTSGVPTFNIQAADIQSSGPDAGWAVKPFNVLITAPSSDQSADFTFTLQHQGAALTRSLTLHLVAAG